MSLIIVAMLLCAGLSSPLVIRQSCHVQVAAHTFYGFPDNDPPGCAIAYDCGRGLAAGGAGTFNDPLTFASAPGEFQICEIIYDPYLRKYLRMEDSCDSCNRDWANKVWHIDIWTGSSTVNGGNDQVNCENRLTPAPQHKPVIRGPGPNLPVDASGTTSFHQRRKRMQIHQLVLFSFVALAASAPGAEDKRSGILDGYESAGDMDFPNAPKNEPTQEPDRRFNGIYIPHTIEWKIPPHRRSEAETNLSSGGAEVTGEYIEN
ncbi:hypothetical protein AARAC_006392 [Aspergillus arachidicola]|uniref:Uncharacterized protein n=2 Tax=Aspergillus arachidicola TaxID=656916 RepID=A0A2G7GDZ4_9EURO|nr:hypothetical protein AARAC_006392 [Aspergillus arachidicola]